MFSCDVFLMFTLFLSEIRTFSGLHWLHRISVSPMISNPNISGQLDQFSYRNSMMFLFEFHQFRYLNSSQLISTHMRTMVLEYLPTKLGHEHGANVGIHIPAPCFAYGQPKIPMRHLVDRLHGPGVKALRTAAAVLEVTGGPCRLAALGRFTWVYHGLPWFSTQKNIFLFGIFHDISW